MFEDVRRSLRDLMTGRFSPDERRDALARMKETLVLARLGLDELRGGIGATQSRLAAERKELETVVRRKQLASNINDLETVKVAERYERQHADRVTVLERKLAAQQAELALVASEVEEMTRELKLAAAGAGAAPSAASAATADPLDEGEGERLDADLDALARARERQAAESEAERKLASLKRRMGK